MDYSDLPLFKLVGQRMNWLNQRQQVLAQNIANSDTPNFRPSDLKPGNFKALVRAATGTGIGIGYIEPVRTNEAHMGEGGAVDGVFTARKQKEVYETNLSGTPWCWKSSSSRSVKRTWTISWRPTSTASMSACSGWPSAAAGAERAAQGDAEWIYPRPSRSRPPA